jgi:hypothetical protein
MHQNPRDKSGEGEDDEESESSATDQKSSGYYYVDAHGYEDFEPDEENGDEEFDD